MNAAQQNIVIPFRGLKDGDHEYIFPVQDMFFEQFKYSEVEKGALNVKINLTKRSQFLELKITISGYINVMCDRCLDYFNQPVEFFGPLYIKFEDDIAEEDNEIMIIPASGDIIDLNHYIYECICLSIPYRCIHPEDENGKSQCNEEMIEKLKEHTYDENDEPIDPRWEQLKKYYN